MDDSNEHLGSSARPFPGCMPPSSPTRVQPVGEPLAISPTPEAIGEREPGTPPVVQIITIPPESRDLPLPDESQIPVRLRNILAYEGFRTFGELHGLRVSTFLDFSGCGPIALLDLIVILRPIGGRLEKIPEQQADPWRPPGRPYTFTVPQAARNLDPCTLRLSARAKSALKQCGVKRLGDLEKVEVLYFRCLKNCGARTFQEIKQILKRAGAGEFGAISPNQRRKRRSKVKG